MGPPVTDIEIDSACDILVTRFENESEAQSPQSDQDQDALDRHAASLQATLEVVNRRLLIRIANTKRRRNALAAIHRLPAELLIKILHMALSGAHPATYFDKLAVISGISSTWRALVFASPSFWVVISSTHPIPLVKTALDRAKSHALDIYCHESSPSVATITQLLVERQAKIRSLELYLSETEDANRQKLITDPSPAMESLTLKDYMVQIFGEGNRPVVDLFGGQAARLRDVSLLGVSIRWNNGILDGLRSLELVDIVHNGPSITQTLHILAHSPQIDTVSLMRIQFLEAQSLDPDSSPPIILQYLRSLKLTLAPKHTAFLLGRIRIPNCHSITADCKVAVDPPEVVPLKVLAHLEVFIASLMAFERCIRLFITPGRFNLRVGDEDENKSGGRIALDVPVADLKEHLTWLTDVLSRPSKAHVVKVDLHFKEHFTFEDPAIFGLLDRMRVTKLGLETEVDIDPMIQWLAETTVTKSARPWHLPDLTHLTINGYFGDPVLKNMLSKRYAGTNGKLEGNNSQKHEASTGNPVPLKSLVFKSIGSGCLDRPGFEEVEGILGPDVVEWNKLEDDRLGGFYDDEGAYYDGELEADDDDYGYDDDVYDDYEPDDYEHDEPDDYGHDEPDDYGHDEPDDYEHDEPDDYGQDEYDPDAYY